VIGVKDAKDGLTREAKRNGNPSHPYNFDYFFSQGGSFIGTIPL